MKLYPLYFIVPVIAVSCFRMGHDSDLKFTSGNLATFNSVYDLKLKPRALRRTSENAKRQLRLDRSTFQLRFFKISYDKVDDAQSHGEGDITKMVDIGGAGIPKDKLLDGVIPLSTNFAARQELPEGHYAAVICPLDSKLTSKCLVDTKPLNTYKTKVQHSECGRITAEGETLHEECKQILFEGRNTFVAIAYPLTVKNVDGLNRFVAGDLDLAFVPKSGSSSLTLADEKYSRECELAMKKAQEEGMSPDDVVGACRTGAAGGSGSGQEDEDEDETDEDSRGYDPILDRDEALEKLLDQMAESMAQITDSRMTNQFFQNTPTNLFPPVPSIPPMRALTQTRPILPPAPIQRPTAMTQTQQPPAPAPVPVPVPSPVAPVPTPPPPAPVPVPVPSPMPTPAPVAPSPQPAAPSPQPAQNQPQTFQIGPFRFNAANSGPDCFLPGTKVLGVRKSSFNGSSSRLEDLTVESITEGDYVLNPLTGTLAPVVVLTRENLPAGQSYYRLTNSGIAMTGIHPVIGRKGTTTIGQFYSSMETQTVNPELLFQSDSKLKYRREKVERVKAKAPFTVYSVIVDSNKKVYVEDNPTGLSVLPDSFKSCKDDETRACRFFLAARADDGTYLVAGDFTRQEIDKEIKRTLSNASYSAAKSKK